MGKYDRVILLATASLVCFGALMIYSSTSVITPVLAKKNISEFYYFKRHIFTIVIGFIFLFLTYYKLKLSFVQKYATPLLIISFVLLVLVFIPGIGVTAGGATRWIRLWPSTFQPSELVKLSMVIYLAHYLSKSDYNPDSFTSFLKPIGIMVIFQVVILKQPDFGAAMSLAFLTFALLFISGTRLRYLASLALFALPVVILLVLKPYRLKRITCFLDPWKEPQGCGFQLVQSFIALGSGGMNGVGLGSSKQKLAYLPESHTDFIFSIIGEEFGLIGVLSVIVVFLIIFLRGIAVANRAKGKFVYYLATGITLMISLQALINFAVAVGLVPTKGLPLPFLSYGGSSLLVNLAAVGMLLTISKGEEESSACRNHEVLIRKKARRNVYRRYSASGS
ncbi:MAG: ftsW [Nitrospirae bacterium]|jgi:cell division protein FtsW|nr:ftsW [Nitrospirota bacterium]